MSDDKAIQHRIFKMHQLMQKRFGPKFWSCGKRKGQMRDPGRELPFTRQQLLDWVLQRVGTGAIPCPYCSTPIDALNLSLDHDFPVSRNGTLELDNLMACCSTCNRTKGSLSADEFYRFMVFVDKFEPAARQDILQRLRTGSMGLRLRYKK